MSGIGFMAIKEFSTTFNTTTTYDTSKTTTTTYDTTNSTTTTYQTSHSTTTTYQTSHSTTTTFQTSHSTTTYFGTSRGTSRSTSGTTYLYYQTGNTGFPGFYFLNYFYTYAYPINDYYLTVQQGNWALAYQPFDEKYNSANQTGIYRQGWTITRGSFLANSPHGYFWKVDAYKGTTGTTYFTTYFTTSRSTTTTYNTSRSTTTTYNTSHSTTTTYDTSHSTTTTFQTTKDTTTTYQTSKDTATTRTTNFYA